MPACRTTTTRGGPPTEPRLRHLRSNDIPVLFDPARHEPLERIDWDAGAAQRTIEQIVGSTEECYTLESLWPLHPLDADAYDLYGGAAGVIWALHYLEATGAAKLRRSYRDDIDALRSRHRRQVKSGNAASYLAGGAGPLLLDLWLSPSAAKANELEAMIAGNLDHPARELMLGAPGTMLAALFMHERTSETRWADRYVESARKLWSQLEWSPEFECSYWTQQLGRHRCSYLGGVHGFAATAAVIIKGRHLLDAGEWDAWRRCIVDTTRATTLREGDRLTWLESVYPANGIPSPPKHLMQVCHGAPGVVICLAGLPTDELDAELVAAGEAIWAAGPLRKGAGLCHGTGGNGYAFLKLYERTSDPHWLALARAFAMHGIGQLESHARQYGQRRYSLWAGDPGFAIYLSDCVRGAGSFPTLEVFFPAARPGPAP